MGTADMGFGSMRLMCYLELLIEAILFFLLGAFLAFFLKS